MREHWSRADDNFHMMNSVSRRLVFSDTAHLAVQPNSSETALTLPHHHVAGENTHSDWLVVFYTIQLNTVMYNCKYAIHFPFYFKRLYIGSHLVFTISGPRMEWDQWDQCSGLTLDIQLTLT